MDLYLIPYHYFGLRRTYMIYSTAVHCFRDYFEMYAACAACEASMVACVSHSSREEQCLWFPCCLLFLCY